MFEWLVTRDWDAAPLLTAFATTLQTLALMVVLLVSLAFLVYAALAHLL